MALTDTAVRNAKPRERTFKLYDEKGLYQEVVPGCQAPALQIPMPGTGKESCFSLVAVHPCGP